MTTLAVLARIGVAAAAWWSGRLTAHLATELAAVVSALRSTEGQ